MTDIQKMLKPFREVCPACGKRHDIAIDRIEIGSGALRKLPAMAGELGSRPFVLADANTWEAAGRRAVSLLEEAGIPCSVYNCGQGRLRADEQSLGRIMMHFDRSCDCIIAVGSGTINDLAKLCSGISGRPYMIIGTAPSMDGFASGSSSVIRDGLKISLDSALPAAILNDIDILRMAPAPMLRAGMGDMLAKYTSICEWRLSALINGEYYCPAVAGFVRDCVRRCVDHADGLMERDPEAVQAVTEGLVLCGMAMTMAGCSRPASGMEHYFSHLWDMRAQEFGTPSDLHGVQCGTAEYYCARIYEYILQLRPDREKAMAAADSFDWNLWKVDLRAFLGRGADAIIALEEKERKYDPAAHRERADRILARWEEICQIIRDEVPSADRIRELLEKTGAPVTWQDQGRTPEEVRTAFYMTKDIRDKYIGSRLLWDLGLLEEAGNRLFPDERPVAYFTEPGTED